MGKVIIENGAMRGRRQQADDPTGVFGHAAIPAAGGFRYPYGLAVANGGSNSYTCLPGMLFKTGLQLNSASGAALYGTAGSAYLSYNPSLGSGSSRASYFCVAKNGTSSKANTGLIHDLVLNYTVNNSANYALPEHKNDGTDTLTLKLNVNYAVFPAIRRGSRIYFHIPCAWGYPFPDGSKFPTAQITYSKVASTYLMFYWRTNGTATMRDQINLTDPARFTVGCEPFGISVEYRVGRGLPEIPPDETVAGVVCTNNTSNAINLVLTATA